MDKKCKYYKHIKSVETLEGSFAHEFGHVFGLKDAYSDKIGGYTLLMQEEFQHIDNNHNGNLLDGEIMEHNGRATLSIFVL